MAKAGQKKVLMALSGGIDSAVSVALLQKAGYAVTAAFMKNWSATTGLELNECPWLEDRRSALRVAAFFGIRLITLDFQSAYEEKVMQHFFAEYQAGRTPNPDIWCNKEIKFKLLYDYAMKEGYDFLATGHYAQIGETRKGEWQLKQAVDPLKDQTYFIHQLHAEQLPHILFPVGGMKKEAVKKLAEKLRLPNATRKESMGICFVGKIRLEEFLAQKVVAKPGEIVDGNGRVLGEHRGVQFFTIGQREGLSLHGGPWYVCGKLVAENKLVVTHDPHDPRLLRVEVPLSSVHFIGEVPNLPWRGLGRYRHQGQLVPLTLRRTATGYEAIFDEPQPMVSAGQSLVFYDQDVCLGGGIID